MHPSARAHDNLVTVIPVDLSGGHLVQQSQQRQRREDNSHRKKNKHRTEMDHGFRDYFRERPRGEFLTRGAAMASQQEYVGAGRAPVGVGGHLEHPSATSAMTGVSASAVQLFSVVPPQSHEVMDARRYVRANMQQQQPILVAQKDKMRNPTILRKKLDICIYLMSTMGVHMEVEEGSSATVADVVMALVNTEEMALPPLRQTAEVFTLWMTSPLLALQLKPHHKPFYIRREWNHFLQRFSSAPLEKKTQDEPILSFQRNVFFKMRDECKIRDHKSLELLYEEAKFNILTGRYPCEISDYVMLGGIQARLELGPYDAAVHTPTYMRSIMYRFLPEHASVSSSWSSYFMPWRSGAKSSPEFRLIEQFKAIPNNASVKRLVRKYLEFCWTLPYYGSAFFHGQIETPARSITSLLINHDTDVLVAINEQGFYVVDPVNVVVLLGLKHEELSWDYAKPSQENNDDCLPCLFIQFCVIENGRRVSKILQIFSRQAIQMDALISSFVDELKQRYNEDSDGNPFNDSQNNDGDDCLVPLTTVSRRGIPESCLSNKLNRLTLATFDDEGHCIGQMGSWSFSS